MELSYIHKQGDQKQDDDGEERSDGFILNAIIAGHVLVAITVSSFTLAGILISDIINSTSNGHLISLVADAADGDDNRANDIPNFLAYINAKSNIRQRFDVDECFQIEIVGVHQDYRQHQIGKKLFEAGIRLAKSKNCALVGVDCTNIYTSKIAEKLGMECVSIVSYDEYNDHLGKVLFVPTPPNVEIKTFVKKLK